MKYCIMFRFLSLHALEGHYNDWLLVIYFLRHEKCIVTNDCLILYFSLAMEVYVTLCHLSL
jgi:hypothetical protein